jgi:hypothetical protein
MKKAVLSLAAMEGRVVIPANSVRRSSLPKIVYEFHKFPAKNPGLLDIDHFITVNTASGIMQQKDLDNKPYAPARFSTKY